MKKQLLTMVIGVLALNLFTGTAQAKDTNNSVIKVSNPDVLQTINEMKRNLEHTNTVLNTAESLNQEIMKAIEESRNNRSEITKTALNTSSVQNNGELEKIALVQRGTNSLKDIKDLQLKTGFKGYNVNTKTNLTAEQIDQGLSGTAMAGLGKYFVEAEQTWNVSALALAGIAANESGWGTSRYAKERHNYYGYQAYDSNPDAAAHFDSAESSINAAAELLAKHYLDPAGKYFNGVTLWGINVRYASDTGWADHATKHMNTMVSKMN